MIQREVRLERATFRLFSVPIVYLPYATVPAGRRLRQSGFLTPEVGDSTVKGYFVGDSYYWAPTEWMDSTLGARLMTRRGWSQNANFRARPGPERANGCQLLRGERPGHRAKWGSRDARAATRLILAWTPLLPGGWRVVADLNELTFAHLPPGVCRDVCAGGELGSAQHRDS